MFVGEAPGKHEANVGIPFVGATGKELDQTYLPIAGLQRREVWIGNTVACHWADASDAPPPHVVTSCSEFHLRRDLERIRPEIVVLMGGISNGLLGLDITTVHGTGRVASLWGWTGKVFSTYHPALGMHMGSAMQSLLEDFAKLREFIKGTLPPVEDEIPYPSYFCLRTVVEVDAAMEGQYDRLIAVDTESRKTWKGTRNSIKYIGWCATFCIDPGTAFMVKVEDGAAWARFLYHLKRFRRIAMHNAPHDFKVLLDCGAELDWGCILDTMDMSYVCGNLPKGLKPLSYQVLSVTAKSFEDVVRPYGLAAAMEYFERASQVEWPKPEQEPTGEMETKKCPECGGSSVVTTKQLIVCDECAGSGRVMGKKKEKKCPVCKEKGEITVKLYSDCNCESGYVTVPKMTRKQGLGQKISRMITDFTNSPDLSQFDPWDRFEKWGEATEPMVAAMGYPPMPSVELVPAHEIEDYACLSAQERIVLEDGSHPTMKEVVGNKLIGPVLSLDVQSSTFIYKPIVGWFKNERPSPIRWMSVKTEHTRTNSHGDMVTRYTPDHKILTGRGMVRVDSLRPGKDRIVLPVQGLNRSQRQLVLGGLVGDCNLSRRNRHGWASMSISHCENQRQYWEWKKGVMSELVSSESQREPGTVIIDGRESRRSRFYAFATVQHPDILSIYLDAYKDGTKRVGKWMDEYEWEALAITYQDNGSLLGDSTARIYLPGTWKWEDVHQYIERLSNLGVESSPYNPRPGQFGLHIITRSADDFFSGIRPFVHPSMQYKLPSRMRGIKYAPEMHTSERLLCFSDVLEVFDNPVAGRRGFGKFSYCIEVEDTHNFATVHGEVASNCLDAHSTRRLVAPLYARMRQIRRERERTCKTE